MQLQLIHKYSLIICYRFLNICRDPSEITGECGISITQCLHLHGPLAYYMGILQYHYHSYHYYDFNQLRYSTMCCFHRADVVQSVIIIIINNHYHIGMYIVKSFVENTVGCWNVWSHGCHCTNNRTKLLCNEILSQ